MGEEIHLPGPSLVPMANAFGVCLMLIGLLLGWGITIAGGIIFLVSLARWIRQTRAEIAELPPGPH